MWFETIMRIRCAQWWILHTLSIEFGLVWFIFIRCDLIQFVSDRYGMVWFGFVGSFQCFAVLNLFWWYFPVGKHLAISHFEMVCTVNCGKTGKTRVPNLCKNQRNGYGETFENQLLTRFRTSGAVVKLILPFAFWNNTLWTNKK